MQWISRLFTEESDLFITLPNSDPHFSCPVRNAPPYNSTSELAFSYGSKAYHGNSSNSRHPAGDGWRRVSSTGPALRVGPLRVASFWGKLSNCSSAFKRTGARRAPDSADRKRDFYL